MRLNLSWSRRTLLLVWSGVLAILLALAGTVFFHQDLSAMLPQSRSDLLRQADFFTHNTSSQVLALELDFKHPEHAPTAIALLNELATQLAPHGAHPVISDAPMAALTLLDRIHQYIPLLLTEKDLGALEKDLQPAALGTRIDDIIAHIRRPDRSIVAPAIYRDVLGIDTTFLQSLQQLQTGTDFKGSIMMHPTQSYAVLLLTVDFSADQSMRTSALMAVCQRAVEKAQALNMRLEPIGAYRHFLENIDLVKGSLLNTIPISIFLIALILFSLFRSWHSVLVLHVPVIFALLAGIAALHGVGSSGVPLMLLGFSATIIGTSIDFGIHMGTACQLNTQRQMIRPFTIGAGTTCVAFGCLLFSELPLIRGLGWFIIGGTFFALISCLSLLPALMRRPRHQNHISTPTPTSQELPEKPEVQVQATPWDGISTRLLKTLSAHPRINIAILVLITALLAPQLKLLHFARDLKSFDGSSAATQNALQHFESRWGDLGGSDFIVATADSADAALRVLRDCKSALNLDMSLLERCLPDRATQHQRLIRWNNFWGTHGDTFARTLTDICTQRGVRAQAFSKSLHHYQAQPVFSASDAPPITLQTWSDTPISSSLTGMLTYRSQHGHWQVFSPILNDNDYVPQDIANDLSAYASRTHNDVWVSSRRLLAHGLVESLKDEFLNRGASILGIMLLFLACCLRSVRSFCAVAIPPILTLVWTFSILAAAGVALLPFHIVVAAFVTGIAVDDGIFFVYSTNKKKCIAPILATSLTSIIGVGSLVFASHPLLAATGAALVIAMSSCLINCLLLCPALIPATPPMSERRHSDKSS